MASKPEQKFNPGKEHTRCVRSSSNENSSHLYSLLEFRSRLTDDLTDNKATVKPPGTCVPKHNAQVVTNETFSLMDDTFKLNYEELKDKPMPFMFNLPPQWEGPVDYQTMAGYGALHSGQEDISTSNSDSTSTISLEHFQAGAIYLEHISRSEQLKVSS